MDLISRGAFSPKMHHITWLEDNQGRDGLLLETGSSEKGWLVVEDIRSRSEEHLENAVEDIILMPSSSFVIGNEMKVAVAAWPSRDLQKVLIATDREQHWRHSFFAKYFVLDVKSQSAQPLDPLNPRSRIQLAKWSPTSDSISFVRDNNLYLRKLETTMVEQITHDGGEELFNGVPDWVYEEEVFSGNSATWLADDGKFIAYLRTNETQVPEYPVQFFIKRPSGLAPEPGLESYPEVEQIKYPKAGAPNPTVDLQFYDVEKKEIFSVAIAGDFPEHDRLITEIVWAGTTGQVLVRETNRVSDVLRIILIDVKKRTGKVAREVDVFGLDGGWLEVTEKTRFIPADPERGRAHDGYVETIIHEGYDHLGYFTPLDNPNPVVLTSGPWEVVDAPSAIDLKNNLVYFIAAKDSPTERHAYSVRLDGSELQKLPGAERYGYYGVTFSTGAGFGLVSYQGPEVPTQKVISTPSSSIHYSQTLEENAALAAFASEYALPTVKFQNVTIDGQVLQVMERLPAHFDPSKKYPVLFYLYGGPGSQTVSQRWSIDFQSFLSAAMGYIVVTVDGRGTGLIGRAARCAVRLNIGHLESHDQIETAKLWAAKPYVDPSRLAIWGWSYGGFLTLKTLEQDGGRTFRYGMAVAPVTDWRYYDSVYTERYMHTPQTNPGGYENATVSNVTALGQNVRFLMVHGVADDNVHMQNSLAVIDRLDLAGIENYDVHFYPDSNHNIAFHNANRMVYDRLRYWLVAAFNGEWLRTERMEPVEVDTPVRLR